MRSIAALAVFFLMIATLHAQQGVIENIGPDGGPVYRMSYQSDTRILLMTQGGGAYHTTNFGLTWTALAPLPETLFVGDETAVLATDDAFYASSGRIVYRYSDALARWVPFDTCAEAIRDLRVVEGSGRDILVLTNRRLYLVGVTRLDWFDLEPDAGAFMLGRSLTPGHVLVCTRTGIRDVDVVSGAMTTLSKELPCGRPLRMGAVLITPAWDALHISGDSGRTFRSFPLGAVADVDWMNGSVSASGSSTAMLSADSGATWSPVEPFSRGMYAGRTFVSASQDLLVTTGDEVARHDAVHGWQLSGSGIHEMPTLKAARCGRGVLLFSSGLFSVWYYSTETHAWSTTPDYSLWFSSIYDTDSVCLAASSFMYVTRHDSIAWSMRMYGPFGLDIVIFHVKGDSIYSYHPRADIVQINRPDGRTSRLDLGRGSMLTGVIWTERGIYSTRQHDQAVYVFDESDGSTRMVATDGRLADATLCARAGDDLYLLADAQVSMPAVFRVHVPTGRVTEIIRSPRALHLAADSAGQRVYIASEDGTLMLYDQLADTLRTLTNIGATITGVSMYDAATLIATTRSGVFLIHDPALLEVRAPVARTQGLSAYPTLVTSVLTVRVDRSGPWHLRICDASGRTVWQRTSRTAAPESAITIPVAGWSAGTYFVSCESPCGRDVVRVVKGR